MNTPDTAPRDTPFLGDFGYPWLQMAIWNGVDKKWAVATVQVGMYDGKWEDTYFESDREDEDGLIGWIPIPEKTNYKTTK